VARGAGRYVGDQALAVRAEVPVLGRPGRLAGLPVAPASRLASLPPGRQRHERPATRDERTQPVPEAHLASLRVQPVEARTLRLGFDTIVVCRVTECSNW
jgi:hypothetical protein